MALSPTSSRGSSGSVPYVSGAGSPVDTVTPTAGKPFYIDTTNGATYIAIGATDNDWLLYGKNGNVGEATGIYFEGAAREVYMLAGERDSQFNGQAYWGDAYALWNGHSNGLRWIGNGTDGSQVFRVQTGSTGQFTGTIQDASGNMIVPGAVTSSQRQGVYDSGGDEVIANGAAGDLAFALDSGTALLDLTDTDLPLFVEAGTYALTVRVHCDTALTAAGHANVSVEIAGVVLADEELSLGITVTVQGTAKIAAAAPLIVRVSNFDGAATRTFALTSATVVKLA